MNQKFVKGILLMAAVFFTAYQNPDFILASTLISMVCVGIGYYVKNYLMPSDSPGGLITWRDILSGLILTIVAAVGDSIGSLVVNGMVDWGALYKMALGVAITYFTTTFFSSVPQAKTN